MSRRFCLATLVAATLLAAFSASAFGAARFYTPDYGSKTPEEIGGFDLGADGSLTPIPGSPFPAEESGLGGLWKLAFTPDGTRAISGFFFTGGVQAYRVPPSGVFESAGATPMASATSVAISPDGRFAFLPTREFGVALPAEGIRRFAIGADGSLAPLTPAGGSGEYGDVAITPDGRFLFAVTGNQIERFAIGTDGSLSSLGMTSAPGARLLAMAADGRFLFAKVSGGSSSGVTSFAIGADGGLQQAGEPALVADSFTRLFAVAPDGRHLYLADSNSNAIHAVAIADDGVPSVVGSMPIDDRNRSGFRRTVASSSTTAAAAPMMRSGSPRSGPMASRSRLGARRPGTRGSRSRSSSSLIRRRSRASAPSPGPPARPRASTPARRCAPLVTSGISAMGRSSPTAVRRRATSTPRPASTRSP